MPHQAFIPMSHVAQKLATPDTRIEMVPKVLTVGCGMRIVLSLPAIAWRLLLSVARSTIPNAANFSYVYSCSYPRGGLTNGDTKHHCRDVLYRSIPLPEDSGSPEHDCIAEYKLNIPLGQ